LRKTSWSLLSSKGKPFSLRHSLITVKASAMVFDAPSISTLAASACYERMNLASKKRQGSAQKGREWLTRFFYFSAWESLI
jgi:hypothetical protein